MKATRGNSRPANAEPRDRGAGTILTAVVILTLAIVTWLAIVLVGWLTSQRRAASVADMAALTAARTVLAGGDGCQSAEAVAHRNNAHLVSCELVGDPSRFIVRVWISVDLVPQIAIPGAPHQVKVLAVAGPAGA